MVDTDVWRKSARFAECDPLERYLFLYLITNEHVSLCGAYEMRLDEIGLYTGLDYRQTLPQMLRRLEDVGLAIYRDGWVVIPKYTAKMSLGNPKVRKGVESGIAALPENIRSLIIANDCQSSPMDSQSSTSPDLVFDSDIDSDSDGDSDSDTAPAADQKLPEPGDSVLRVYRDELSARLPITSWPDTSGQYGALRDLTRMTRSTQPQTPIETPEDYALLIVRAFERRKSIGKTDYWRTASFEPKTLLRRFGELTQDLAGDYGRDQIEAEGEAALARLRGGR
jgi:hypothetical protein